MIFDMDLTGRKQGGDARVEVCLESMALLSSLHSGCGERWLPEIIFRQGWSFNAGLAQSTTKTLLYSFNPCCFHVSWYMLKKKNLAARNAPHYIVNG